MVLFMLLYLQRGYAWQKRATLTGSNQTCKIVAHYAQHFYMGFACCLACSSFSMWDLDDFLTEYALAYPLPISSNSYDLVLVTDRMLFFLLFLTLSSVLMAPYKNISLSPLNLVSFTPFL